MELATKYDPREVESKWYQYWLDHKLFSSRPDGREPYTVVIPPPNVTGVLHMGHMLNNTIQDILVRRARMEGKNACWVPGTDHASIATEAKVVARLAEEGIKKSDLTREEFLRHAWDWTHEHGGIILKQLRRLGASCDWDRTAFTMDEERSKSVIHVFVDLYKKGLIYRGVRMVNWDPKAKTALSDEEVVYKEEHSKLYYLKYYVAPEDQASVERKDEANVMHRDDRGWYAVVATTRPETIMGDTAMCINPDDAKNTWLKGKHVVVPKVGRTIPVIEDGYVDIEFGTGCLKATPAHDINDHALGLKHNLETIDIFNDDGTISEAAGLYVGLDRMDVRKQISRDLNEAGLMEKIEDYTNKVGFSERTNVAIEPKLSTQWFLSMQHFADIALAPVMDDEIEFYPKKYKNTYRHWLENIKDWCISRQLWWGHRIPAWYCDDCGATTVSKSDITACPHCGSSNVKQDPDTLDTWFSSALWPFSTLGWPEKTADLEHYYPTNTLVTGYDIIGFWVSRMIFSGLKYTGKAPFDTVLIHGLVRDAQGRKMSKSLGNGIDPLEIIDKYGADALRFTLATGNSPGNDMRFSDERVEASRNFANKIWNAARFILMNLGDDEKAPHIPEGLALEDKWILSLYNDLVKDVTDSLEKYELGMAVQKLYDFIWDVFCDWYIELSKIRLGGDDEKAKETAKAVLVYVMSNTLKLLHPFMPFITEEIWQTLPHDGDTIMLSPWAEFSEALSFPEEEEQMNKIMTAVKAVRNRRAEMNVAPSKKAQVFIETLNGDTFKKGTEFFKRLSSASDVSVGEKFDGMDKAVSIITESARIYIPMDELVDFEAERERLNKEKEKLQKDIDFVNGKLNNPNFVSKAPEKVVEAQRKALCEYTEKMKLLDESLNKLINK